MDFGVKNTTMCVIRVPCEKRMIWYQASMDFSADDEWLSKEPGDMAFLQMTHYEVAHPR